MFNPQMIEQADELRTLAQQRRNRGRHTGKLAKGWAHSPRPAPAEGSADYAVELMLAGWRHARGEAIEQLRFELHGNQDQWEDFR